MYLKDRSNADSTCWTSVRRIAEDLKLSRRTVQRALAVSYTHLNWSYHLNAAEQEVLARKMEAFYQQQTGTSLHEYARQLRESGSQTPEMQM